MPLEGQYLGHYRRLRLLGSGGMDEVYLAEDARIGQQVAIKVIRNEGIAYPGSESAKEAARLFANNPPRRCTTPTSSRSSTRISSPPTSSSACAATSPVGLTCCWRTSA